MTLRISVLALLCLSAQAQQSWQLESPDFRLAYDNRGVTSLSTPKDPFNAQLLSRDQRLGVFARYRAGADAPWTELGPSAASLAGPNRDNTLTCTSVQAPLKVSQTYRIDGAILDWTVQLENSGPVAIEVGDLAI